ncbi:hypothetical protein AY599_23270 [Leptolyngbya valderiana BDU 20041]|nr:hypothetical protein AY599_23270 [Leptolyngbya valderiana BDU 20041]
MVSQLLNNRYLALETLGTGGFGQTYLAEDTHLPSRRRCVIKQLQQVTQTPDRYADVCTRFEREAAVLEELGEEHPQIPRLYAYFSEAGRFYLVQEWIDGDTLLQQVQQRGLWNEGAVVRLLRQILPVLDFIHSRHIVHRDVKPENIVVRRKDDLPVLIDFGAVKEAVNAPELPTKSSVVIGTPGFMSSEQAAGRPTYASDLYSLALTAIYLLSGTLPQDIAVDRRTGELRWREVVPNLRGNLATTLERAVRFHPRDRFSSASEMLAALTPGNNLSSMKTIAVAPAAPSQVVTQVRSPVTIPQVTQPPFRQHPPRTIKPTQAKPGFGRLPAVVAAIVAAALGGLAIGWESMENDRETPNTPVLDKTRDRPDSPQPIARPAVDPTPNTEPDEPAVRDVSAPRTDETWEEKKQIPNPEPEVTPESTPSPEVTPAPEPTWEPQIEENPEELTDDPVPTLKTPSDAKPAPVVESESAIDEIEGSATPESKSAPATVLDWGDDPAEVTR